MFLLLLWWLPASFISSTSGNLLLFTSLCPLRGQFKDLRRAHNSDATRVFTASVHSYRCKPKWLSGTVCGTGSQPVGKSRGSRVQDRAFSPGPPSPPPPYLPWGPPETRLALLCPALASHTLPLTFPFPAWLLFPTLKTLPFPFFLLPMSKYKSSNMKSERESRRLRLGVHPSPVPCGAGAPGKTGVPSPEPPRPQDVFPSLLNGIHTPACSVKDLFKVLCKQRKIQAGCYNRNNSPWQFSCIFQLLKGKRRLVPK